MPFLYMEYIYPIMHYFKIIRKNEVIFDLVLPTIIAIIGFLIISSHAGVISNNDLKELLITIITLLAILVGFTISSIATLVTTSEKLDQKTERKIGDKFINLYQLSNIFLIFSLFSEIAALILNLSALVLISYSVKLLTNNLNILVAINILLISHILFITIRNITSFYFTQFVLHSNKSGKS